MRVGTNRIAALPRISRLPVSRRPGVSIATPVRKPGDPCEPLALPTLSHPARCGPDVRTASRKQEITPMRPPADPDADPGAHHRTELTVRGLVIGGAITIVFMAANVYLGLKTGMTFSSSIPAAIISMAVLRLLGGGNILENNMVQTQASAAGTLCKIILGLPGLAMIGHWHGFPFWQTMSIAALGGFLGVLFSIPLRRALVVDSKLPFPEGIAAA